MLPIILKFTTAFIVAYIIGSIPTGYIIVKALKGIDIRTVGSGSTGATNVKRVMGTKWFFIVMLLDALKGVIAVLIAKHCFETSIIYLDETNTILSGGLASVISAVGVIVGHSKSCFLKFTGGKSVATGVGTILAISPLTGLSIAAIWGTLTYFTKYVSVGSVIAVSLSPIIMLCFEGNLYYVWFCSITAIFIILRHKENIIRLINGTENKVR